MYSEFFPTPIRTLGMAEDVGRAKAIALTNAMDHEIAIVHCVAFGEGGQMLVCGEGMGLATEKWVRHGGLELLST